MKNIFVLILLIMGFLIILISSGCCKKPVGPVTPSGILHSGTITKDETWREAGNPHIIEGDLYVWGDSVPTLRIEPGVIVRFKPEGSLEIGRGSLIANGTKDSSILFTSNNSPAQPGDWKGINFSSSVPNHSILNNCIIEYTGFEGEPSIQIGEVHTKSLTISNSTIRLGKGPGINVGTVDDSLIFMRNVVTQNGGVGINFGGEANSLTFIENIISQNGGAGINLDGEFNYLTFAGNIITQNSSYPIITSSLENIFSFSKDNNLQGNAIDAINALDAIFITYSGVLPDLGIPYNMSELYVDSDSGASLTLEPGCKLKFMPGVGYGNLSVSLLGHGALVANGTIEKPIIFTSADSTPEPGDWAGIEFYSSSQNSTLNNCIIEYGGRSVWWDPIRSNIRINEASPTITNNIIRNSRGWGIYIRSGSPIIENNTFSNNALGDIGP